MERPVKKEMKKISAMIDIDRYNEIKEYGLRPQQLIINGLRFHKHYILGISESKNPSTNDKEYSWL